MSGGGAEPYIGEENMMWFNNAMKIVDGVSELAMKSNQDVIYCLRNIGDEDLELLLRVHNIPHVGFKLTKHALDAILAELAQRSLLEAMDE